MRRCHPRRTVLTPRCASDVSQRSRGELRAADSDGAVADNDDGSGKWLEAWGEPNNGSLLAPLFAMHLLL